MSKVEMLGSERAKDVIDVLSAAFRDYPVMHHVLGGSGDYAARLHRLVGLFVMARVLRGEPLLGLGARGDLKGAAIVSYPGRGHTPAEFARLRDEVFHELGPDVRARYEAFGEATSDFAVNGPHIHLNMIGVRPGLQGQGLGRRLIDRVHRLSVDDPTSRGVTLTTENPANVPIYEKLGYSIIGHARVAPGLETWGFYRPD
jgi:GNAT superfamily N-acetyltransferase